MSSAPKHLQNNHCFPDHMYDEETGRTFQAIRIQQLKEENKKCGNCRFLGENQYHQHICKKKEARRVEHYNICQLHEKVIKLHRIERSG